MTRQDYIILLVAVSTMLVYFLLASPVMMDDGFHYEGFTEALAHGKLDFKSFYGFQGLSILSVPIYWLTGSHISIIITSAILYLFSLPLAYLIGKDFYPSSHQASKDYVPEEFHGNKVAGLYFMILILLMPYTYTTMLRGFQEAALLFFILLTIYGSLNKKLWTPIAWSFGGIIKPFNLVLLPLFAKDFLPHRLQRLNLCRLRLNLNLQVVSMVVALAIGGLYLGASYYQTGHLVNNAAIGSYQGNFDAGNPPPLWESFVPGVKGFLRVGANLMLHTRKIMISPIIVILGIFSLLLNKSLKLRKEIIISIVLNFILVGSLTFSFSKYLLPMVVLFALASVGYLLKYKWLMMLVLVDSYFVFMPIWSYFGHSFWSSIYIYSIPLYLATAIYFYAVRNNNSYSNS